MYGALGFQPEVALDVLEEDFIFLEKNISNSKILAIGEIGLDYHYDVDRDRQREIFKRQLVIARMNNKPVIIHSRECIQETFDILKEFEVKGIMHCYSGSVEMAREFCKMGFYIGVGGISTFKNANKLIEVIKNIPLEYIVLETDSPYLSPEPYRGRKNHPENVGIILEKICEIKKMDFDVVSGIIADNVFSLFDKKL